MSQSCLIEKAVNLMIEYNGKDARRINHAIKVLGFARQILCGENCDDETALTTSLAAVFHDIGIHNSEIKYGSSSGTYQQIEGPPVAAEMLDRIGIKKEMKDRVCFIIANHHTYERIDNTDFRILVEADLLVNFYEDGTGEKGIAAAREKVFRTAAGKRLLDSMYGKG